MLLPCLTCHDGETIVEINVQVGNQGVVAYM